MEKLTGGWPGRSVMRSAAAALVGEADARDSARMLAARTSSTAAAICALAR
jgi:hypothetical protein